MKATELRIGNLVEQPNTGTQTVTGILNDKQIITTSGHTDKYLKPIPLTEEWLLKFGFDKLNWGEELKYRLNDIEIFKTNDGWRLNVPYHITICKNVHSLQNLYFALTGEELKYL